MLELEGKSIYFLTSSEIVIHLSSILATPEFKSLCIAGFGCSLRCSTLSPGLWEARGQTLGSASIFSPLASSVRFWLLEMPTM